MCTTESMVAMRDHAGTAQMKILGGKQIAQRKGRGVKGCGSKERGRQQRM